MHYVRAVVSRASGRARRAPQSPSPRVGLGRTLPRLGAMSQPGWYPDPSGRTDQYRYWDGTAWSQQTSAEPLGSPPGASSAAGGNHGPRRSIGPVVLVGVFVVLLALVVALVWRGSRPDRALDEDHNSSTPSISAWDETTTPTPTPTDPDGEGGDQTACPPYQPESPQPGPTNGRFHGGGVSYAEVPGWEASRGWGADWLTERDGQRRWVVPNKWLAMVVVGQVSSTDFPSMNNAPGQLIQCLASSEYFRTKASVKVLSNGPVTIDGRPAFKQVSEVRPPKPEGGVVGDVVTVVAIDAGRPGYWAIFVSEAAIGDQGLITVTSDALASVKVES